MYRNDQPVRMPLGIAKIYYDMPQRIAHPLKQHLIDHFNRKRYYEYHSGYRPVPPDHEQYIRQAILRYGWTRLRRGLPVVNVESVPVILKRHKGGDVLSFRRRPSSNHG